ncbi:nucleoside hydrolase [Mariniblastus fucicola]|uniref:Pyrimidine-specific ribonucleoside hydrolase RihB n=1 Tax=Mariniblastus fucicola TaxID=980251 RepID=A0A5B9PBG6_9BACT|nr:nucleoside hydrolase [Mariniblastus fucicola]QEG22340.1 Pyrimidine-specific ribonucleoside hydrolase RihB [Mariniblastus fucicola]
MKINVSRIFCVLAISFTLLWAAMVHAQDAKPKLILDADTANEIDDQYAIIRIFRQDKFDVIGLNSAQWFHYLGQQDSVQASQKLNERLVELMGVSGLPLNIGAERPMGKPWGGDEAKDSPAAQFIIKSARELANDEKLYVVCIGASTNLASAIKLAPEIAPKIKAYVMGFQYDFGTGTWNKSEFNVRRDLNAVDFLLNQKDLELHVMSATTSGIFKFEQGDSFEKQARMGPLGEQLTERWTRLFGSSKTWVMWDLALVEAMIDPSLASEVEVTTPPENTQRKVWMYKTIDVEKMRAGFWAAALAK